MAQVIDGKIVWSEEELNSPSQHGTWTGTKREWLALPDDVRSEIIDDEIQEQRLAKRETKKAKLRKVNRSHRAARTVDGITRGDHSEDDCLGY